jgi:hypothetical protein
VHPKHIHENVQMKRKKQGGWDGNNGMEWDGMGWDGMAWEVHSHWSIRLKIRVPRG